MEGSRRFAWLMGAAALVPLLLFLILQAGFSAQEQRRTVEGRALAKSEAIIAAADGEVKRIAAGLDALATARSLRARNLEEFRSRAAELANLYSGWTAVTLIDRRTGATLLASNDERRDVQSTAPAAATVAPRLAGYARGPGCPCILFDRTVVGPPGTDWVLRLLVNTARFDALLPPPQKEYEVSALVGPRGRFISRSIAREERFGNPASVYLRRAVKSGAANGIYSGLTLEGFQNYTAFTRSPMTGWSAHVAVASNQIDNPANRFLASLGIAGALSLALAGVLIWYALRQAATGRRIAERMQQAQKLEALGQLTGGIAHDFNNLLTPIVGALHFLSLKPELDARARRLAGGALASAERAAKLTAQLLAFSRRQKLQIEPIDVSAMMEEVSNLVRQSIDDTHQLEVTESNGLCAYCDLNQLELAILNLVLNARDASPPGSTIHITVDADGEPETGRVMISVRDEGNGMDQDTQRRAFEPFFTTKQQGSGTGLGLAQVFGMAEQSGGSVRIDSAPGKGTSVTITLRRCPTAGHSRISPSRAAKLERLRPLRLLVADDEPEVRMAIVRPLEDAGHIVDVVSDGPTALAAITERPFDLVLIDFAMPGMNGAELIQRAREVRADTRFLIISGYADSDAIAVAAPATAILRKPFAASDLTERVKELLA